MTRRVRSGSRFEELAAYSRAVERDGWIFVSGTMGADPDTGNLPESASAQAENALETIGRALAKLGAGFGDILQCRIFLTDRAHLAEIMPVLRSRFAGMEPANTTVITQLPVVDAKLEIEVIARGGAASG